MAEVEQVEDQTYAVLNRDRARVAFDLSRAARGSAEWEKLHRELLTIEDDLREHVAEGERAVLVAREQARFDEEAAVAAAGKKKTELEAALIVAKQPRLALAQDFDLAVMGLGRAIEALTLHQQKVSAIESELGVRDAPTKNLMRTVINVLMGALFKYAPLDVRKPDKVYRAPLFAVLKAGIIPD